MLPVFFFQTIVAQRISEDEFTAQVGAKPSFKLSHFQTYGMKMKQLLPSTSNLSTFLLIYLPFLLCTSQLSESSFSSFLSKISNLHYLMYLSWSYPSLQSVLFRCCGLYNMVSSCCINHIVAMGTYVIEVFFVVLNDYLLFVMPVFILSCDLASFLKGINSTNLFNSVASRKLLKTWTWKRMVDITHPHPNIGLSFFSTISDPGAQQCQSFRNAPNLDLWLQRLDI